MSHLLVLCLPVLITLVVLYRSQMLLQTEVQSANDTLLLQIQQTFDGQFRDIRKLGAQLSLEPKLISLLSRTDYNNADARLSILNLISSLHAYGTGNGAISDFYLYFKKFDVGITTSTFVHSDILYKMFHERSNLSFNHWKQMIQNDYDGNFLRMDTGTQDSGDTIVFLQSLPLQDAPDAPVTLLVMLNQDRIKQAFTDVHPSAEGEIVVVNRKGELMLSTGAPSYDWKQLLLSRIQGEKGFFTQRIGQEEVAISYIASTQSDWTYLSVVPKRVYASKVDRLKQWTLFSALLCLSLGFVLSYLLTTRNYRPVRRMLDMVSKQVKMNMENARNEFLIVQQFLTESAHIQDESNRREAEQRKALRSQFLSRLLKGRVDNGSALARILENHDFRFETELFAVVVFLIEDFKALFRPGEKRDLENEQSFLHLIITNIAGDVIGRVHTVYFTEIEDRIVGLVNLKGEKEQAQRGLLRGVEEAKAFIEQKFYIRMTIAVSDARPFLSAIPDCYDEALSILEYKLMLGANQILTYELVKAPTTKLYYPLDLERQLINFMTIGNYEEASGVVHRILIHHFAEPTLSVQLGKLLMFELVSTMLKALEQLKLNSREILSGKQDFVEMLTGCTTFAEMEEIILKFLKSVCEYTTGKKKSHNTELKEHIMDYIHDHLTDINLSSTMISLHFQINPSYLSKFFKEQTGMNVTDFINLERIGQAKRLLTESELAITDITEKSGFTNSSSFIRAFKRYEGITPGQYRQKTQMLLPPGQEA